MNWVRRNIYNNMVDNDSLLLFPFATQYIVKD